jgi:hypothetical protein
VSAGLAPEKRSANNLFQTRLLPNRNHIVVVVVLIVDPKLFIEPGAKAFFRLSSVSDPGL